MKSRSSYLGMLSRAVVIAAIAASAASAMAQKAPPAFKKAPADCFKYPLTLPEAQLRTIADTCEQQFLTARRLPDELANAGVHAGAAHNRLQAYGKAAPILERVVQDPRAGAVTREDARYQLALAYVGLGGQTPEGPERAALLGKGITALDAALASPGLARGSALYNLAVFQRATAYQNRAAGTFDYSNAIDGFSVIADGLTGADPALREAARKNLIAVATTAGSYEMKSGVTDASSAQRAASIYEKALRFDPRNMDLNIGLGAARLAIAASAAAPDRAGWFERAGSAFSEALKAGPTGAQAAAVNLGLARSSRALGRLRDAIGYYKSAIAYDPANRWAVSTLAETQVEYARSLADGAAKVAAYRDAEQTYLAMFQQSGTSSAYKAAMLMTLANVQSQQPGRTEDVRRTLLDAIAIDPGSPRAPLQVGRILYNQSSFTDAANYFQQVINLTGGANGSPSPTDIDLKSDAFYYLSLINSRLGSSASAATMASAVSNADAAVRLAASRSPYREQACIARIIRGGASVTAGDASSVCASNDQADGMLLLGLFHLKRARYLSAASRPSALELAQVWFDQGLREFTRSGLPAEARFRWPGSLTAPAIRDMLQYGKAKVVSCTGLSTDANLSIDQIRRAEEFFRFYGVDDCTPVR